MKTTNFLLLLILSFTLLFNGCSSTKSVVSVSETHLYNNNYGLHSNLEVDNIIQNELMAMNNPTEVDMSQPLDPEWTTDLKMDDDAFLAEDYVSTEPVISYKYEFDKKFYDKAEWRKANF